MANVVYSQVMYNDEIKRAFLSQYSENTSRSYGRIFLHSRATEEQLGKDLFDFSVEELDRLIASHKPPTIISARMIVSVINNYIVWSMVNGYAKNNALDELSTRDNWPQCHVVTKKWITEQQVEQITNFCQNAQDAVLFRLLFEGVGGIAQQEIINLTIEDVDVENKILTLRQDGEVRTLPVSDKLIELILDAHKETTYYVRNGVFTTTKVPIIDLIPSNHVVKNCRVGASEDIKVSKYTIWKRMFDICKVFGIKGVSIKSITLSGKLYYAGQFYKRDGKLEKEQYEEIADRFAENFWWSIRDKKITPETIHEVYGDE